MILSRDQFTADLRALLAQPVEGVDRLGMRALVTEALDDLERPAAPAAATRVSLRVAPFVAGRRPLDEAQHPGHGCSERVALLTDDALTLLDDELWILFDLGPLPPGAAPDVRMTASFVPKADEFPARVPIPGLVDVPVAARRVRCDCYPTPALAPASYADAGQPGRFVAVIHPLAELLPRDDGAGWRWEDIDARFRAQVPDGRDPFTFSQLFHQRVEITLSVHVDGEQHDADAVVVEVFDARRSGTLYQRLVDQVLPADVQRQARALGVGALSTAHHPWWPVLRIGSDKAWLYTRAICRDLVDQHRNLPDALWLLRVGLYLELLTCLGVFEALRGEHPNILTPEERGALERSPAFAGVRRHLDVTSWRRMADTRDIAPRSVTFLNAGPVSMMNLLRKQKATMGFLHTHHDDLKHAIAMAGPNLRDAQETWHRVFRDAERAVLRNSLTAFPELRHLPQNLRDMALWYQKGALRAFGKAVIPGWIGTLFGDQDGIYPAACRNYRASMNDVAVWARARGLMDFTGDACVPASASLFEAHLNGQHRLLAALQRRDGFGPTLDVAERPPDASVVPVEEVEAMLARVDIFAPLRREEVRQLAAAARRVSFGHQDRVVLQGDPGTSLFVVDAGTVEVLVRNGDGRDLVVASLERGAVFGEMALLTGDVRAATVRAVHGATLYEIDKSTLQPIIEGRQDLLIELSVLLSARRAELRSQAEAPASPRSAPAPYRDDGWAGRISRFVLGR